MIDRIRPFLDVRTARPLGTGYDHAAYEVNGELVARLDRIPDPESVRREAEILASVRAATRIPVPELIVVEPDAGLTVYRKLRGAPLSGVPRRTDIPPATLAAIEGLMRDIAGIETDVVDDAPPSEWRDEARDQYAAIRDAVPAGHTDAIERFLADDPPAPLPADALVFCHNDLGAEHILVDPDTRLLTGVIDWSDAARTDPAQDRGRLYRDLRHPAPDDRALFFARCAAIEDLHFGRTEGRPAYWNNAVAALDHLFRA